MTILADRIETNTLFFYYTFSSIPYNTTMESDTLFLPRRNLFGANEKIYVVGQDIDISCSVSVSESAPLVNPMLMKVGLFKRSEYIIPTDIIQSFGNVGGNQHCMFFKKVLVPTNPSNFVGDLFQQSLHGGIPLYHLEIEENFFWKVNIITNESEGFGGHNPGAQVQIVHTVRYVRA